MEVFQVIGLRLCVVFHVRVDFLIDFGNSWVLIHYHLELLLGFVPWFVFVLRVIFLKVLVHFHINFFPFETVHAV